MGEVISGKQWMALSGRRRALTDAIAEVEATDVVDGEEHVVVGDLAQACEGCHATRSGEVAAGRADRVQGGPRHGRARQGQGRW